MMCSFLVRSSMLAISSRPTPNAIWRWGTGTKLTAVDSQKTRHFVARDFSVRRFFYGGTQWLQQATFFRAGVYRRSPGFNLENRTCWDGELFVQIADLGAKIGYIHADLAGFRIHETSISGSGRMNEQYQRDCRRIFRQLQGHEWKATDELLHFFYRVEGVLKSLATRIQMGAGKNTA